MKHRSKQFFTALISVAALGCGACSTTTQSVWPSQAALSKHNIVVGDTVLVRYLNDPYSGIRVSSRSEQVRITGIDASGISGIGEEGSAVAVNYDQLFGVDARRTGIRPIELDYPATKTPERIILGTLKVAYLAACVRMGC